MSPAHNLRAVSVAFSSPLDREQFESFIKSAFGPDTEFLGDPQWLGPTKVHVTAVIRTGWKRIDLEITSTKIVALGASEMDLRPLAPLAECRTGTRGSVVKGRNGVAMRCQAGSDGDCHWAECPQLKNYQSHCPLDKEEGDGE